MENAILDAGLLVFGGQNQIVNQQEQNREVNQGGLTQTDSEETLYGPKEEQPDATGKITGEAPEVEKQKLKDIDEETAVPVKNELENV